MICQNIHIGFQRYCKIILNIYLTLRLNIWNILIDFFLLWFIKYKTIYKYI